MDLIQTTDNFDALGQSPIFGLRASYKKKPEIIKLASAADKAADQRYRHG